jgi:hypothetical protein
VRDIIFPALKNLADVGGEPSLGIARLSLNEAP